VKTRYENFTISATYTGSKQAPWTSGPANWNHHYITVSNRINGKRTRFDFWASIAQPELRKRYDLLHAFYCFITDALSGQQEFDEFCSEFGYDVDSIDAHRTWQACKRAAAKLERIYPDDLFDLANELQDIAG
jgi:hypothetical protein